MKMISRYSILVFVFNAVHLHATTENDLLIAVNSANLDGVRRALSANPKPNINVKDTTKDDATPLLLAIVQDKANIDIVNALITAGADINAKDKKGNTALMKAASFGHLDVVQALLKTHADVDIKRNDGQTALMLTLDAAKPNEDIVRALVDVYPNLKLKYDDIIAAIKKALDKKQPAIAKMLANTKDKTGGCTLLITAVDKEDIPAIETLAKAGADVNAACTITPASVAASKNNPKIISALGAR